jgi:hypothetical protein
LTLDEALKRRHYYRGQLRRHKNAKRNATIREFWKSKVASEMEAGSKPKAAHTSATESASERFNISTWQVRRALKDTKYLIDAAWLKHSIRELSDLAAFNKRFLAQGKRIKRYENHVIAAIQKGYTPAKAHTYAIERTAKESGITNGQMRRFLHALKNTQSPEQ